MHYLILKHAHFYDTFEYTNPLTRLIVVYALKDMCLYIKFKKKKEPHTIVTKTLKSRITQKNNQNTISSYLML